MIKRQSRIISKYELRRWTKHKFFILGRYGVVIQKDTASPMKKYANFFRSLNCNIDRVYSYGFSYGKVDRVYIKEIISRISKIHCGSLLSMKHNHEALRIKKIKLRVDMVLEEFWYIYDG